MGYYFFFNLKSIFPMPVNSSLHPYNTQRMVSVLLQGKQWWATWKIEALSNTDQPPAWSVFVRRPVFYRQPLVLSPFLCWGFSPPLLCWFDCLRKEAQRSSVKQWWGQGEQGELVEMIIYSLTFSPLFQIDYQLCLQSTIYCTDQKTRRSCLNLYQTASFCTGVSDLLTLGCL